MLCSTVFEIKQEWLRLHVINRILLIMKTLQFHK